MKPQLSNTPLVSIIICTRNRAADLALTLDSVSRLRTEIPYEVIVCDNGSTDITKDMVLSGHHLPEVVYLHEPHPGKSIAANTAVAAARGKVLQFFDDDVRPMPDCLDRMCEPIISGRCNAVQGRIYIAPHLDRPWLTGMLRVWLAEVKGPYKPVGFVGANFAITKELFLELGGFDKRLGPGAAGYYDDTLLGWKAGGETPIYYETACPAIHHFHPSRLRFSAFITAAHKMARSRVIALDLKPAPFKDLLRHIPGLLFRCCTQAPRLLLGRTDPGFLYRYYHCCLWVARRNFL